MGLLTANSDLIQLVPKDLMILIVATYILGCGFKYCKFIKDEFIVLIFLVFDCVLSMVITGFTANSLLQGIICWGVAVGINNVQKQLVGKTNPVNINDTEEK